MLQKSGGPCVLQRERAAAIDPVTGLVSGPPVVATTSTYAVSSDVAAIDEWRLPSSPYTHRRKLTLAALPLAFAPEAADKVLGWEGATWTVAPKGVQPVSPDGITPVLYDIWITR